MRIECSGVPLRLRLDGQYEGGPTVSSRLGYRIDGTAVDGTEDGKLAQMIGTEAGMPMSFAYEFAPAAGSHLFQISAFQSGTTARFGATAARPLLFSVEELRPSANNGTA